MMHDDRLSFRQSWWERLESLLMEGDEAIGARAAIMADWLPDDAEQYCWRCGATCPMETVTEKGCSYCVDESVMWNEVFRLGAYEMPLTRWIAQMKFAGAWGWARWLGMLLGEQIKVKVEAGYLDERWLTEEEVALCPVPLHWRRRWSRGYDQAALMAKGMSNTMDLPVVHWLQRHRATKRQSQLAPMERGKNVRDAFGPSTTKEHIKATSIQRVILVDDVKTTGATAKSCVKILRQLGVEEVALAVIAVRDPRTIYLNDDPHLERSLQELAL